MKKLLLTNLILCFTILSQAQTTETYFIDWSFGSNPSAEGAANSNRTIEVGDTVTWTWYASGSHSVENVPGSSVESFDSGILSSGETFSYTFTQIGENDYICGPHPGNMFGKITVVEDGTLSTNEFLAFDNIKIYPNPAKGVLNLDFEKFSFDDLNLSIYNTLGQQVKVMNDVTENTNSIDVSNLNSGLYLLKIQEANSSITMRFMVK